MQPYLKKMVEIQGSDLFICAHACPALKLNGKMITLSDSALSSEDAKKAISGMMSKLQWEQFHQAKESNFAYFHESLGRFRVSAYYQRGDLGMVVRRINTEIPTFENLGLLQSLKPLIMSKRGLFLIVGATGAGKSTTMASLLNYRNELQSGHIISLEDPIEFVHTSKKCIFSQREIGFDTDSYEVALKNALRQAPDVIHIGEIRCQESMKSALNFAETGHLCIATMHSNNANQALERIIHLYPKAMRDQVWLDLSLNLRAVVAQQLIPRKKGGGRALALEIMVNTPAIANHIRKGEMHLLKDYISRVNQYGMQSFDQALLRLIRDEIISVEDGLAYADTPNDLRLHLKLVQPGSAPSGVGNGMELMDGNQY